MANDAIMVFDGTPTTVLTGVTGTLADGLFSTSSTSTIVEWDNSTDKWPLAVVTFKGTYSAAPDNDAPISLYCYHQDLAGDTADDQIAPSTTSTRGAEFLGQWKVQGTPTTQFNAQFVISTLGFRKVKFAILNEGGDALEYTPTAWTVEVEGFTLTPST